MGRLSIGGGVPENSPNVIVAEKDLSLRHRIVDLLRDMGIVQVESTPSGTTAWALLKRQGAELVVAGWNLQEIGGLSLLKIMRADADFVTTPFLLLSEVVTQAQVVEAGEAGVSEILCRPITLERLRDRVNELLYPTEDATKLEAERVYARGLKLMEEKRWQEAMAVFQHILTLFDSPEVYYNLGYINTVLERYEEAIVYFRRATEIDQTFAQAYQRMGECYKAMGQSEEAKKCLNLATDIYKRKDEQEETRSEVLQEVMRVNPKTINIFNTLGIIYRRQGRFEEAADQYRRAIKVNPKDENIHYNLARTFFELKDYKQARQSLIRSLELNPAFEEAAKLLSVVDGKLQTRSAASS
jgi:tetratricopeptide (TPR) repeat protein